MTSFRPALFSWGLLAAIMGITLVVSVSTNRLTLFHVVIISLGSLGVVLAIAAMIPRKEETSDAPADAAPADIAVASETATEPAVDQPDAEDTAETTIELTAETSARTPAE